MNTPAVLRRDPAVAAAVVVLWLLLALFVVYPMATLLGRVLVDKDGFSLAGIVTVLTDRHQVRAFWNSLALGALVGVGAGALGQRRRTAV